LHLVPGEELGLRLEASHVALVWVDDLGKVLGVDWHFKTEVASEHLMDFDDFFTGHSCSLTLPKSIEAVLQLDYSGRVDREIGVALDLVFASLNEV
jgi:hypothetical protein